MKKIISYILSGCIIISSTLTGCTSAPADIQPNAKTSPDKFNIICTISPIYDWVHNLVGEDSAAFDVTLLHDNGADLHNYQPSTSDIALISSADLFIYVGGESDAWTEDVLKTAANQNLTTVNLMDVLGDAVKEEEIIDGMQSEHEHEEAEDTEYDEHVWLSLKNARTICTALADKLSKMNPNEATILNENANFYNEKLSALDLRYQNTVEKAAVKTLLFGDRFPFRYLVNDYGLEYYAAFPGCSAETEASFETIVFLANKVNELKLKNIFVIDGSDASIAKTIMQNTDTKDQQILTLNSIQSSDLTAGQDYLTVMEQNLNVLETGLNN